MKALSFVPGVGTKRARLLKKTMSFQNQLPKQKKINTRCKSVTNMSVISHIHVSVFIFSLNHLYLPFKGRGGRVSAYCAISFCPHPALIPNRLPAKRGENQMTKTKGTKAEIAKEIVQWVPKKQTRWGPQRTVQPCCQNASVMIPPTMATKRPKPLSDIQFAFFSLNSFSHFYQCERFHDVCVSLYGAMRQYDYDIISPY